MWHVLGLCTRAQVSWQLHDGSFLLQNSFIIQGACCFFIFAWLTLKHLILCHVCHLGLIVSWERSKRGQHHWLLFLLQSIHLGLPRLNIPCDIKWKIEKWGKEKRVSEWGGADRQCQAQLNQLRCIKSRIHARWKWQILAEVVKAVRALT